MVRPVRAARLLLVSALGLAVPGLALAHGGAAMILGSCLPALTVPVLFLVSLLSWRLDAVTMWLIAAAILGVGAAMVGINFALLAWTPIPIPSDTWVGNIWWWGVPFVAQAAAWFAVARWRRRRGVAARP